MAKVTGIGGIFFKSRNKGGELALWYQKNLGLDLESWGGAILKWPDDKAGTVASRYGTLRTTIPNGSARANLPS